MSFTWVAKLKIKNMLIILESTIDLLFSAGEKETVENLIQQGEVKQTKSEIKYLKIEKYKNTFQFKTDFTNTKQTLN